MFEGMENNEINGSQIYCHMKQEHSESAGLCQGDSLPPTLNEFMIRRVSMVIHIALKIHKIRS